MTARTPPRDTAHRTGTISGTRSATRAGLAGADNPDALYRAAGNGSAAPGARAFPCPSCRRGTDRVIRVRLGPASDWVGVCAICAASVLSMRPGSVVGGLVRPIRRRRERRAG